jgi:parvulin-like peptidyl-prolyl isomerase
MKKKFRKRAEKVKDLVPANVAEHLKPKSNKEEELTPLEDVPRITNETIAVHREEVLKGARKYIYPLQHSKHRIIMLTSWILVAAVGTFLVYSVLALYKLNQYNTFLYRTTQVVPFPIARVGDNFVAYENYLKEEILSEKVVAKLDKADTDKANSALLRLKNGEDFAKVAAEVSNDPNAKANGGDYGFPVTRTNPNVPPQVVSVLYKLQPGQISAVINTGSTLEIVKNMQATGDSIIAKHIVINQKDISDYTKDLKKKKHTHILVKH